MVKVQHYAVAVDRKDGTTAYLRHMLSSTTRTSTNTGLVTSPADARLFEMDAEKAHIIAWMDEQRTKITRYCSIDTIRIVLYEWQTNEVSLEDIEWKTTLQRSGVSKLSRLEVVALGLEKYEIERRMSKND